MTSHFQTIVVGLGAMGSATVLQLSKRKGKVLGLDSLAPPHTFGSTHGDTRITRQAIGEGEHYSPLALRSYELFREVEKQTGQKILEITGGLIISNATDPASINHAEQFLANTVSAAKKYKIAHDMLDATEIRKRFPQFNVRDDEVGYFEHEAAFLRPELTVQSQLDLAKQNGAEIHLNEKMLQFTETANGVTVKTEKALYTADKLVLSVGPWLSQFSQNLQSLFKPFRQVLYWFDISQHHDDFALGKFPIFIWQLKGHDNGIYGFPAIDGPAGGFKVATEVYDEPTTPESCERTVSAEETQKTFEEKVRPYFPNASSRCVRSAVCIYTVTPDGGFVIDWLPSSKRILLCSPCSGHGFKHSSAIGEAVADLVRDESPKVDLNPFRLNRFENANV
ncbi:MAG TPA: N-methyl-L-tryptophan oxidase [Drouetiella sp.]